ncbi:serine/threonine protein phosphatase [Secundilactobacillus oryzae JCM 18671]|uniref:protein-serine/threonine phosphatase n=1 Tax=Secundilactobacillus oryzae JCM 18671 TaxID=1291743 RepID=A0A081BFV3_9LACO|nr:Stp1/IreP family PP2C-type Ser/Thr phosphatase [Secundilactobacillus oryzae]GAK46921.1 serine/threonine protein phosphatase [Secundilactobacillus oryzae JCM 18671]
MEVAYQTAIGRHRTENQDYVSVFKNAAGQQLAIIADGIGGNHGGDVASAMAVSHIGFLFQSTQFEDHSVAETWLHKNVQAENEAIIEKSQKYEDLRGMGTTIALAVLLKDRMIIANIGDSRGYLLRAFELNQITEDHSLVNELVKRGELSKKEAANHPQKNVIIRSLGISSDADLDTYTLPLETGDLILLCTDGLTNMVSDDEIKEILLQNISAKDKCQQLIDKANTAGGLDNITVLIFQEDEEVTA